MKKNIINYLEKNTSLFFSNVKYHWLNEEFLIYFQNELYMKIHVNKKYLRVDVMGFEYFVFYDEINSNEIIFTIMDSFLEGVFCVKEFFTKNNKVIFREILFESHYLIDFNRKEKVSLSFFVRELNERVKIGVPLLPPLPATKKSDK